MNNLIKLDPIIRLLIRSKCKRNAKIARYNRKQCTSVKKFRNKLRTFQPLLAPVILEKYLTR